jgi:hypothetical protein
MSSKTAVRTPLVAHPLTAIREESGNLANFTSLSVQPLGMRIATVMNIPQRCLTEGARQYMEIRFISSLTAEDEDVFAPAVLKAVSAFLDQLPIAYTMRIETTGAQVFQHTHVVPEDANGSGASSAGARFVAAVSPYGLRGRSGD